MSGTRAFFQGLPRAAQRPGLTLALAASTAGATLLFVGPFFLVLRGVWSGQAGGAEFLSRGDLSPLFAALAAAKFSTLAIALIASAILIFFAVRLFLAGGLFARLHPSGGTGLNDSFFGYCARYFWQFLVHALLNDLYTVGLIAVALPVAFTLGKLGKNADVPKMAQLANAGAALCLWIALSLSARALDLGRAHIMNLGGFRPLNALLTGVRGTLGHPISALGLSAWGGIARLLLFAVWFGLDFRLHIHGTVTWVLACLLLLIYLLLSSFLRVTLAAGAYVLLGRN